ncbi:MAG: stage III sporulation protein AG, partial [Caldicoprobacter oshimai]
TIGETGNAKPLVIKEMEPEIKGVIVIAEGAKDIRVKLDLIRAVQTALGVSPQQVEVFEMETNKMKE